MIREAVAGIVRSQVAVVIIVLVIVTVVAVVIWSSGAQGLKGLSDADEPSANETLSTLQIPILTAKNGTENTNSNTSTPNTHTESQGHIASGVATTEPNHPPVPTPPVVNVNPPITQTPPPAPVQAPPKTYSVNVLNNQNGESLESMEKTIRLATNLKSVKRSNLDGYEALEYTTTNSPVTSFVSIKDNKIYYVHSSKQSPDFKFFK